MTTAQDVLDIARGEIGVREAPNNRVKYGEWYGLNGQPWCAMFVSWVFYKAGMPLSFTKQKGFAYTPAGVAGFKAKGRWHTSNPKPGDVIFFDFPGDRYNRVSHVGIVESIRQDGTVICIEGNTDDKVKRTARTVGIVGYGRPAYSNSQEEEDMALSTEERKWIKEVVADSYRLLARGEIEGKRSEAHYLHSTAGLREYVKRVGDETYRLLARGELNGQRSEDHYLRSTTGLREQLLTQEQKIVELQQDLKVLKLKLQNTPLPSGLNNSGEPV